MNKKQISTDRELLNQKNATNNSRLLTTKEAAAYLRVSPLTLWRMRRDGKITFHRINGLRVVYKQCDLDDYLKTTEREAFSRPALDQ